MYRAHIKFGNYTYHANPYVLFNYANTCICLHAAMTRRPAKIPVQMTTPANSLYKKMEIKHGSGSSYWYILHVTIIMVVNNRNAMATHSRDIYLFTCKCNYMSSINQCVVNGRNAMAMHS